MDVYVPIVSIDFPTQVNALLQASESQNSRGDQVLFSFLFSTLQVGRPNGNPALEDSAQFLALPYFPTHAMEPRRGAEGALYAGWFSLRT